MNACAAAALRLGTTSLCAIVLALPLTACNRDAAPVATPSNPPSASAPASPALPAQASARQAPLTLPGQFAADTTAADLGRRFGSDNVSVEDVPGGEGSTVRGVVLYPGDTSRRAYLYFQDEKTLRGLRMVRITDAPSQWVVDPGIRIGMPLRDLLRINGKPIRFLGFDWDYGGNVSDWNGGALAPQDGEMLRRMVRLALPEQARRDIPYAQVPIGDDEFSSNDPRFNGLQAVVDEIGMSFPGEDDL